MIDKDFDDFWQVYPRNENKFNAKLKYAKATRFYDAKKLKTMLERYINEIQFKKIDKKFVPHAATWLHQKRFLDYEDYEMQVTKEKQSSDANWYDDLEI